MKRIAVLTSGGDGRLFNPRSCFKAISEGMGSIRH